MSKAQLKKELAAMEKGQIIDLMLEAYSARKEIKGYFEYFLNPDVEALMKKYEAAVDKELKRVKRGSYSKARISFIKKQIKEFALYQPGYDKELEFMMAVFSKLLYHEAFVYYPEVLNKGTVTIMTQILELADRNQTADRYLDNITSLLHRKDIATEFFRRMLLRELNSFLSSGALNATLLPH